MKGVPIGVNKEELDRFNECLAQFQADAEEVAPKVRMLGMLVGIPDEEGTYGVMALLGPKVSYEQFVEIIEEQGKWMKKFLTQ